MELRLKKNITRLAACALLSALAAGCTSSGAAVQPTVTQANLNANVLQFAVGTANLFGTKTGLNTVATYRQPGTNISAVLLDTPTITGPAGFVVTAPASAAGTDSGTNHISGGPQPNPVGGAAPPPTTFGPNSSTSSGGGVFSYGFAPQNSSTAGTPNFTLYPEPFFNTSAVQSQLSYYGGPPLYPNPRDGTYPVSGSTSTFVGWTQGFTAFDNVTLAAGVYTLSVTVPTANTVAVTQTATASLTSLVPLPAVAPPVFARAGVNGGTVTFTVPAGAVEAIAYVVDNYPASSPNASLPVPRAYFSAITHGAGLQTVTISDNLGPHANGAAATPTFSTGDKLTVYVVAYDYPAYEAGPPASTVSNPTIVGAGGQADVSLSPSTAFTY